MGKKEDEKLLHVLKHCSHIPINHQHKENVATMLKAFVPVPEESSKVIFKQLFKQVMMEFWQYQKLIICALCLFLLGMFFILDYSFDYKLLFFITTPLSLVLMGWRMFEDYREDMVELLSTYKFTYQQIICAKVVAISSIAFIYYTFFAIYLLFSLEDNLLQSIFHLLVTGITPILTWALLLLIFLIHYRSQSTWGVLVLSWFVFALLLIYTPLGEWFLGIHISFYLLLNFILVIFLWKHFVKTWRLERIEW